MKINLEDGSVIELDIKGYEYPDPGEYSYSTDWNWLMASIKVTTPEKSWEASFPGILADELEIVAPWLREVADEPFNPAVRCYTWASTEPLFYIRDRFYEDGKFEFVFTLANEFSDPTSGRTKFTGKFTADELQKLADDFQALSKRFPARAA